MTQYKRFILLLPLVTLFFALQAAAPSAAVKEFIKTNGAPSGSVAVKIINLLDGSEVVNHNSSQSLIPASIMKSVTTAALLGSAGPDWKYHTRVFTDGPNDLGYLRGNIIVSGVCDPTINSEKEPVSNDIVAEICDALTCQLINRIEGTIIVDESEFAGPPCPASWGSGDLRKYYGTGSHAFNFQDNARGDYAVDNPSLVFVSALKNEMQNRGIEIEGKDLHSGKIIQILDHCSAPIDEIMRSCMMRSDNMFAESMLRTFGKLEGCDGSTNEAVKKEFELWNEKQFPLEGVTIVDGSGLSRSNRITADFMAEMLKTMSDNPYYASFFPLAGQEGTLKKFLKDSPLDSYVAMKTGSMTGIQCYAGYKLDDDYIPTHVIVIMMNDLGKTRERAVKAAEKLLLSIFE